METIEVKSYEDLKNKIKEKKEEGDKYLINYDFKNQESFRFFYMTYLNMGGLIYPKVILVVSNEIFEKQEIEFLKFLEGIKGFNRLYKKS